MAGAGPSGVAAGASGFTTIYPVTECMEVGEGNQCVLAISDQIIQRGIPFRTNGDTASSVVKNETMKI